MSKSIGAQYANWCVHFNGMQNKVCRAGVNMRELVGGPDFGWATRMPCVKDDNSTVVCELCHYPTPEEVQAHEAEQAAHMQRFREDNELIGAAHNDPARSRERGSSYVYVCEVCERESRVVTATSTQMIAHLRSVHSIAEADIKSAHGSMAAHMDATDWFQTDDRFALPDGRPLLLRSTRTKRRGSDKALWRANVPAGKKRGKQ